MKAHDFLLEVGVEEIPDWMIVDALAHLKDRLFAVFGQKEKWETHATPRRLVLFVPEILEKEPDRKETVTGPPVSAGPGAAQGFARKMGVEVGKLKLVETPKGKYLSFARKQKGRRTRDILSEALPGAILGIPWPKAMTWTGKSGPRFIRPIRWLVALYGGKVVPFEIAGVKADRYTYGHRRLAADERIRVTDLNSLREGLSRNFVVLDGAERRRRIEEGIAALLSDGLRIIANPSLLDTLVNLTEFPTPILGSFDAEFLSLPSEVLITVMQHHQKYFSVEDSSGKLAPHFVAVMNIDRDQDGIVRHGNERVLRARFNDARFFWETDQKKKLADRLEDLKDVTYYRHLNYWDKTKLVMNRLHELGGGEAAYRAAQLSKCDLTTELVKEFPELQGVVGGLYARAQGEPEEVALAIYDQYQPVPRTREGQLLALADRIDTLQTFFQMGQMPTGSKDPFAVRRAALGVVRILVEGRHSLSLSRHFADSKLCEFILDRARYYFREVRGYPYDEVNAVLAAGADNLTDVADRLEALSQVRPTENFEPLATSFKRIKNILRQAGMQDGTAPPDPALLEPGPERDLYDEFERVRPEIERLDYLDALKAIASLRPRVDLFFDKVLVMAPDEKIRRNRLNFLAQLLREFSTIADFSEIVITDEGGSRKDAKFTSC